MHQQFRSFVARHRPRIELDKVATGEHWLASEALQLELVDELRTSDDYLLDNYARKQVVKVQYKLPKGLTGRLGQQAAQLLDQVVVNLLQRLSSPFYR